MKSIDLNINIKNYKKEEYVQNLEHDSLKGNPIGVVSDFIDDFDGDESANVDKNPSRVLTKAELEVIKQKNNDRHECYKLLRSRKPHKSC